MRCLLFFIFLWAHLGVLEAKAWNNQFFVMSLPDEWRLSEMDYVSSPLKTLHNVSTYKDVCFAPGEENGVFVAEIYVHEQGGSLDYRPYVQAVHTVFSESTGAINGLMLYRRDALQKVLSKGVLVDYYATYWYIQGQSRVYYLKFGSYSSESCFGPLKDRTDV